MKRGTTPVGQRGVASIAALVSTAVLGQTGLLFAIDMVTNVTDYAFHVYLGQVLAPGDFAVVQTVNAAVLIIVTTFAVLQPAVARFVAAEQASGGVPGRARAIFQRYLRQSALLGVLLGAGLFLARDLVAGLLNVPATAVALLAALLLLAVVRPVVMGMQQGLQRFGAFGLTRTAFAGARLALALLLVGALGGGAVAAVATMPLGMAISLLVGLAFLGTAVWQPGAPVARDVVAAGWRLSLAALIAYAAFMSLQSVDLFWVNRTFTPALAGSYATAVVLRRVLAVLPGAVIVILYPRVVKAVADGRAPDREIGQAAGLITAAGVAVTAVYALFAPQIVMLVFGPNYPDAIPLLGWMGVAMIGYGLASVWLNVFLATRPWPFILLVALTAVLQLGALARWGQTLPAVTAVFGAAGWLMALGAVLLYLIWLRPAVNQ